LTTVRIAPLFSLFSFAIFFGSTKRIFPDSGVPYPRVSTFGFAIFAITAAQLKRPQPILIPARPDSIHAPEAGFISEHDAQLPPAPSGSPSGLPHSIRGART
jgi:hypothetical protein